MSRWLPWLVLSLVACGTSELDVESTLSAVDEPELGELGEHEAPLVCLASGPPCPSGQACLGGFCLAPCAADADCKSGERCTGGACTLPVTQLGDCRHRVLPPRVELDTMFDPLGSWRLEWGQDAICDTSHTIRMGEQFELLDGGSRTHPDAGWLTGRDGGLLGSPISDRGNQEVIGLSALTFMSCGPNLLTPFVGRTRAQVEIDDGGVRELVSAEVSAVCPRVESRCADGIDDDADGLLDCRDPDCTGRVCSDGAFCTTGETCQADGQCGAGEPVFCGSPPTVCHSAAGTCDEGANRCVYPALAQGSACDDGTACTQGDVCSGHGICSGAFVPSATCQCAPGDAWCPRTCTSLGAAGPTCLGCHAGPACAPLAPAPPEGHCASDATCAPGSCRSSADCGVDGACVSGVCTSCAAANTCLQEPPTKRAIRAHDGRLHVFMRGSEGAIWRKSQQTPAGAWGSWQSLGGALNTGPAVGLNVDGRLEVFARATNNAIYRRTQTAPNGSFGGWVSMGGVSASEPAVARASNGRLMVFVRGSNNALYAKWQTSAGGSWSSGWASLGGNVAGPPVALQSSDGRIVVFAAAGDRSLRTIAQRTPGGAWGSWANLGGTVTSGLSAVRNGRGEVQIFARNAQNLVASRRLTSTGWSGWVTVAGAVTSNPGVGRQPNGRLALFGRASAYTLLRRVETSTPGVWSAWAGMGGDFGSAPIVTANQDGRLELFVAGRNKRLYSSRQTAVNGAFGPWVDLAGSVGSF